MVVVGRYSYFTCLLSTWVLSTYVSSTYLFIFQRISRMHACIHALYKLYGFYMFLSLSLYLTLSPSFPISSYLFLSLPCVVWNIGCPSVTNIYVYIYIYIYVHTRRVLIYGNNIESNYHTNSMAININVLYLASVNSLVK